MMKEKIKIPRHVGIIMDGNRRWAREHKMPIHKGHEAGVNKIESTVEHAKKKGIESVSFWAFSTDNWKRDRLEVQALMLLFRSILSGPMIQRLIENGVKINPIGDITKFSADIQKKVDKVVYDSRDNKKLTVNLGLNYGGQEEIVYAANQAFKEALKKGKTEIDEKDISDHTYIAGQPGPDLIIRTGGEKRSSGFLMWQSKSSEWYYPETYWPDFDEKEFDKALVEYASRDRRFGK